MIKLLHYKYKKSTILVLIKQRLSGARDAERC